MTNGARILTAWRLVPGNTFKAFARKVGVSQPTVSDWASDKTRPKAKYLPLVNAILGTTDGDWLSSAERKRIEKRLGELRSTDSAA